MTQERLAELVGVQTKHLQRIESRGPCNPRLSTIQGLAKAFKMTVSEFLDY